MPRKPLLIVAAQNARLDALTLLRDQGARLVPGSEADRLRRQAQDALLRQAGALRRMERAGR